MEQIKVKIVATIPQGRFGVMIHNEIPFAVTLERTFDGPNGTQTSVIPYGANLCKKDFYHKGGYATFEVQVPGHDRVLFHKLNIETQSEGCMGVGEQFGVLDGVPAILQSGAGFDEFMSKVSHLSEFELIIEKENI